MTVFSYQDPKQRFTVQVSRFTEIFSKDPMTFLSGEELNYFDSLVDPSRKAQYLQSRYWVKKELSQRLSLPASQIEFQIEGEGKPVLKNSSKQISFNISHTREYCALVFSDSGTVGVDIEKLRKPENFLPVMQKVFTKKEIEFVQWEPEPVRSFVKIWSSKEAIIKAAAGGVFRDSRSIQTNIKKSNFEKLPDPYGALSSWHLKIFEDVPEHILSVAFQDRI